MATASGQAHTVNGPVHAVSGPTVIYDDCIVKFLLIALFSFIKFDDENVQIQLIKSY